DTTGHIPSRRQRLLSLHEPARRDAGAARGLERIVDELAEQLRVAEGELGFDRDNRGIAVLGDRGTLAGPLPATARHRSADAKTDKRRETAADEHVVEARWIGTPEDAPRAQRRRIDDGR